MDEAAECDLLVLMREGGLVAIETPDALRERTSGTLERLMSMPVGKLDLLAGYGVAFALVEAGVTILVSSHVMDEAAECDLLVLMREGGLVAVETPEALRERTGVHDLGEAFLRLIEPAEEVAS